MKDNTPPERELDDLLEELRAEYQKCPDCHGKGSQGFELCALCQGEGFIKQ